MQWFYSEKSENNFFFLKMIEINAFLHYQYFKFGLKKLQKMFFRHIST